MEKPVHEPSERDIDLRKACAGHYLAINIRSIHDAYADYLSPHMRRELAGALANYEENVARAEGRS